MGGSKQSVTSKVHLPCPTAATVCPVFSLWWSWRQLLFSSCLHTESISVSLEVIMRFLTTPVSEHIKHQWGVKCGFPKSVSECTVKYVCLHMRPEVIRCVCGRVGMCVYEMVIVSDWNKWKSLFEVFFSVWANWFLTKNNERWKRNQKGGWHEIQTAIVLLPVTNSTVVIGWQEHTALELIRWLSFSF